MLLSRLTPGEAKPVTRPEEVLPMGPRSAWFCTLSALQTKPRYLLGRSAPWVPPSTSVVGRSASVWAYCLVHASEDVNCSLPR
jgi:hypothetical protein